jgi:amino acid exporter
MSLAMGVAIGSLTWGLLTVIGLSALLTQFAYGLIALKIFGGFYLLWLSYKAFKSARANADLKAKELAGGRRTGFGYFARGFLIQMTNPKAALAWIAIISLGLSSEAPAWVGMVILSGTFVLSLIIHTLYALAFSTKGMVSVYVKARRWIQGTFSVFFALAGLKLLTSKN